MELLQLRYFYESAKHESFALAAKKYMVPTSSVSASVKRLENELGASLFDRTSNRIRLNDKGYAFFGMLEEVFLKIDKAVAAIAENAQKTVTISVLIKARRNWITELIIQYKEQFPHVHFQISHDALLSNVEHFDVIIDEQTDQYMGREAFLLSKEQICIKAAKDSPLVGQDLSFAQLRDCPFVIGQKGNRMWHLLEKAATRSGFVPSIAMESNDRQCMIRYVESGMGLILGTQNALQDESERGIAALNVIDFNETQLIYVYHRVTDQANLYLGGFLTFLKTKARATADAAC